MTVRIVSVGCVVGLLVAVNVSRGDEPEGVKQAAESALADARPPAAAKPLVLDVWPGEAPGEPSGIGEEKVEPGRPDELPVQRLGNVTHPTLTVYRPAADKDTHAAVLIAPGGGYNILAWDKEGTEVAEWLNTLGVTGIVLKYRVPRRPNTPKDQPPVEALQDAQRGMSLVRSKSRDWGIDPQRIGMLGFSAGGHLTAWTASKPDERAYAKSDIVDEVSCRPDFSVLVYTGGLVEKDSLKFKPEIRVTNDSPPAFLAHASDDRVEVENSLAYYLELKRAGVRAELHAYSTGGHGFGLRPSDKPAATWPARCAEWLRVEGWLKPLLPVGVLSVEIKICEPGKPDHVLKTVKVNEKFTVHAVVTIDERYRGAELPGIAQAVETKGGRVIVCNSTTINVTRAGLEQFLVTAELNFKHAPGRPAIQLVLGPRAGVVEVPIKVVNPKGVKDG